MDLLDLHLLNPARYPVLLESASGGALGRFDLLLAFPGESLRLDAQGALSGRAPAGVRDFLDAFDAWWRVERRPGAADTGSPFTGGWFVFLAYELAGQIEPRLRLSADAEFPVAMALRVPAAIVRERETGRIFPIIEAGREELLAFLRQDLAAVADAGARAATALRVATSVVSEDDPEQFLVAVDDIRQRIARGDVYQVNISRQWRGALGAGDTPARVYARLRQHNPAPFASLVRFSEGTALLSSSPERLVSVRDGCVRTRPIAGTRPRSGAESRDRSLREELVASAKERAEHVMLIDLERNDLGRVCMPGSVKVDEFMTIESYAHVHHIVSDVSGRLRPGTTPGEVLRALFPGGTITGCPKVRCMEIIRELEDRPRGPYTGSIGYVNLDGSCDFNILIRTIAVRDGRWRFNAGGGIVADSIPERELEETRAKAKGMLLALAGERPDQQQGQQDEEGADPCAG